MHIIGTAGHVDHGKTLLIKALTGIDTDRLPEEKKRGLTIDLGFAHFSGPNGEQIGVVDVPGHEKFIRNMTAGAWGIDLALLVIAADDGWMYQTENHLRVLTAMGISRIITVITKTDIAEDERIREVIEDSSARILEQTGLLPPAAEVSALKGEGIAELKTIIIDMLPAVPHSAGSSPLMYIDRSFTIRGAGLVVTGSLREGTVSRGDSMLLLPSGKEVRIRGIQTYDTETDSAAPACRTALNISGVDSKDVSRGCCLTTNDSGFTAESEFIMRLSGDCSSIRNHSEAEFATGTAHGIGTIHLLKDGNGNAVCARVVLEKPLTLGYGRPVVIIRKGGSLITGSGTLLWKGKTDREARTTIMEAVEANPGISRTKLMLAVSGWTFDGDRWLISDKKSSELEEQLMKLASESGGVRREELAGKLGAPSGAADIIIKKLTGEGKLTDREGNLFAGSGPAEIELSKTAEQIISKAEAGGRAGLDLGKSPIPGARKEMRPLVRAGLMVPLTENLFYTVKNYNELTGSVLKGMQPGDTFDIAHAKNRTGLSRKYIIPLLNKMEEQGLVERDGNLRRVMNAGG